MISTAAMARQYSIGAESIRWTFLDGRGEFSVASSGTESVDDKTGERRGKPNELFEDVLYRV